MSQERSDDEAVAKILEVVLESLDPDNPWSVRAIESDPGCWDVVLRLDGTYFDSKEASEELGWSGREAAERSALQFRADLYELAAKLTPHDPDEESS